MIHGLIISNTFNGNSLFLKASTPIVIVGTAATGTNNQIYKVSKSSDLLQFGDRATGTIVKALEVLQKYGCSVCFVIKVATGADAAATDINIIGTEPSNGIKTGLPLIKDIWSQYLIKPQIILTPFVNSDTVLAAALAVAVSNTVDSIYITSFSIGTSTATATTVRGTTTGLGTKNPKLIVCLPNVKNALGEFVPLSLHIAGLIAKTTDSLGFGYTPSNKPLVDAVSSELGYSFSYTDALADNQKLENLGIVTLNINSSSLVAWGNRNASFVDNVNEKNDTYIVLQRIKQVLNAVFENVQSYYIDQPCNFSTGKNLETALKNVLQEVANLGNLNYLSTAVFNLDRTDYAKRTLAYDITVVSDLPTETITSLTEYSVII